MKKLSLLAIIIISSIQFVSGQGLGGPGQIKDDGRFAASTKQLNQFFRRFNAEESEDGMTRYHQGDEMYHNRDLRIKYVNLLFDNETSNITKSLKQDFVAHVTAENYPQYLNFHRDNWFAEVSSVFTFKGKRTNVTLFMEIQPEGLGFEWVIKKVAFDGFKPYFDKKEGQNKPFLHPLSHELGFMNLRKALQDNSTPESYTPDDYEPDYLTLFLYEIKSGNMKFETVNGVKFHFFQIEDWYFEVSQFNRPGFNTGWLMSNLTKVDNEEEKQAILNYIYDQK
ncbi:hypothetical protein [Echinicola vietnamensis]|uniref:Uncharacterized protein n=1 Tax=Echinicola vietnamensis (strain DSM 17526 / LMG 23754 / KMM 6221) TaxID=926556 RepID=L0FZC7_ECHVK|nr:hypothetical protein [Echinicola vietnamensis]AGA79284.1 hypothetical protein Echvi_3046 [Echinicola vietnamensis DSM 17526]